MMTDLQLGLVAVLLGSGLGVLTLMVLRARRRHRRLIALREARDAIMRHRPFYGGRRP